MRLHIHGHDLPTVVPHLAERTGTPVVGVQRRTEPDQLQARATDRVHWVLEADLVERPDGSVDLRGPYVQGRPGDRFVYLTWGFLEPDGSYTMVRRAKLMLAAVDPELLRAAERTGEPLVGTLGLTGRDGTPLCAAVRPPTITWTVGPCAQGPTPPS